MIVVSVWDRSVIRNEPRRVDVSLDGSLLCQTEQSDEEETLELSAFMMLFREPTKNLLYNFPNTCSMSGELST